MIVAEQEAARNYRKATWLVLSIEEQAGRVSKQLTSFLDRYKTTKCHTMAITEAAAHLGRKRHQVAALVDHNTVWHGAASFTKARRTYMARIVDVDEVHRVFAERSEKEMKQARVVEAPPVGLFTLAQLSKEFASKPNTMLAWIRRKELAGKKFITLRPGIRNGQEWYVDRDEALALFRKKRAGKHGANMRRNTSIPVTPLIQELWSIDK